MAQGTRATGGEGGLPAPRRQIAAVAVLLSVAMSVLLGSIVNLALPVMAEAMAVSPAQIVWVVTAYQLALLVALLPCASLGEILGYHRVFLVGLAGVAVGGVVCAMAPSLPVLVAARGVQGIAGAAVMSITGALLRHSFPPSALGRAIGLNAMVVALAGTLGPGLGALILAVANWHWVFASTVPLAVLAGVLGFATLPRVPGSARRFDAVGAGLNLLTFGLLFLGADRLPASLPLGAGLLGAGGVAAWLLVRHQRGQAQPLLPLDLLAAPAMRIALVGSVSAFASQMLALVALPFLMRAGWGIGPAESGALLLWWPLAVGALAPVAGRLSDRVDTGLLCAIGAGVIAAGLLALAVLPPAPPFWLAAGCIAACGFGFGLFQTPNARAILSSAPLSRSGGAGGMQATARQFGMGLGTLTAAALFQLMPEGAALRSLQVAAGLALVAGGLSLARWLRGARG